MAKDRGVAPDAIKTQILIYPWISPSPDAFNSYREFDNGYPLHVDDIVYYDKIYFAQNQKTKFSHPLVATVEELQGLPPTLMITAEADILRDEGEAYARKLMEADVKIASVRLGGAGKSFLIALGPIFSYIVFI
ncbi:Alpha/beta hydrolase fold-3, partial [Zychaea mexicana]|uniref:Alpha/beta hydrolase fold-3 n=1 Tax=Zychaea mexicana TaxID=64656 RepID=UPI0022FE0084